MDDLQAPDSVASWSEEPDVDRYRQALHLLDADPAEAMAEFEHLAELGSVRSMLFLGFLHDKGESIPRDPLNAERWYNRAIDGGAVDGWYYLGRLFSREGAYGKAVDAFREGARQGHVLSINRLAMMYFNGTGVDRDIEKARELWERASSMGHLVSRRHLAIVTLTGRLGVLQIPRGLALLWSALADIPSVARRDPKSDLLGQ